MKNKSCKLSAIFLTGVLILSGCGSSQTTPIATETSSGTVISTAAGSTDSATLENYFSNRDLSGEIDYEGATEITLNGDSITSSSDSVTITGSTLKIVKEGTYILSGTLNNGNVIVDTESTEKVQIVLNGVSITSNNFAPIYVANADKVFITLADSTKNTLINGGTFTQIDDHDVDAVIYSRDDITLNGTGTLVISSPTGKGISGKDEVTITNGTYEITSEETAIRANECLNIADGCFTLNTKADGLHAEDNDDDSVGSLYIAGGTYNITAGDDGIHATTTLTIDGGTFDITSAEGLEASYVIINNGTISIAASDDGINAAQKSSGYTPTVEINGGDITIVMGSGDTDGVDSNGNIVINGGTVNVTGNSTFDYDGTGVINGGTVIVNGETVTTLPNQDFGGGGMKGGKGNFENGGGKGGKGGSFGGRP